MRKRETEKNDESEKRDSSHPESFVTSSRLNEITINKRSAGKEALGIRNWIFLWGPNPDGEMSLLSALLQKAWHVAVDGFADGRRRF